MKILTIIFASLLLSWGAHGAIQPVVGSTEVTRANNGRTTNQWLRNPVAYGVLLIPTNTGAGAGTISGTAGTHTLTVASTTGLRPGYEIAIGVDQYDVARVINGTSFYTVQALLNTYVAQPWDVYTNAVSMEDVVANQIAWIGADGGYGIVGSGIGNSGRYTLQHDSGDGFSMQLGGDGSYLINDNEGLGWGAPFIIMNGTQARFNAITIMPDGPLWFYRGFTNQEHSVLGSNVFFGFGAARWQMSNDHRGTLSVKAETNAINSGVNFAANGNVGIGTATPTNTLHVAGPVMVDAGSGHSIRFHNNGGNNPQLDFKFNGGTQGSIQGSMGSGNDIHIVPKVGGNSAFTVGNVGIGTTTPADKLDVIGNSRTSLTNFSTNGFASFSTQALVTVSTTGYTNTTGRNVFWIGQSNGDLVVNKFEKNGTQISFFSTIIAEGALATIPLKPGQWVTTSGILTTNIIDFW